MTKFGKDHDTFNEMYRVLCTDLLATVPLHIGEWQSMDTSQSPAHATHELTDVMTVMQIPPTPEELVSKVEPNMPWAEEHFLERVSGIPHNPPPSHTRWPWARHNANHQNPDETFSHTYPERFWPTHAGGCHHAYAYSSDGGIQAVDRHGQGDVSPFVCTGHLGIRFRYGDLSDVVDLLVRSPLTRQAYLPVWFPEDTGAHHGQRVPCTLGYHFMIRDGALSCRYYIRSCDIIRHFRDDLYLAARLTQWVAQQVNRSWDTAGVPENHPVWDGSLVVGKLVTYVSSLHAFKGDTWKLKEIIDATA